MTQRERARAAMQVLTREPYPDGVATEDYVTDVIWRAIVEGSSDELARRRAVEKEMKVEKACVMGLTCYLIEVLFGKA